MSDENNRNSLGEDLADLGREEAQRAIEKKIKEQIAKQTAQKAAEAGAKAGAAAASAGATASASGASAGATAGATTAGGAGAAGAGAATGGVALIVMAVLGVAKKLKDEVVDTFDPMAETKAPTIGGFTAILLVICIVVSYLFPSFFVSNGSSSSLKLDAEEAIESYKATELEGYKKEFFEWVFSEYGITPEDIFLTADNGSIYSESNAKNFEVYKATVNHAIERAFSRDNGWVSYFIENSLIEMLNAAVKRFFEGDGMEITKESFFNSRYPYCLNEYTVNDYLNGVIPEDELNDDLNYAEVLSILQLNENVSDSEFTFSDLYDLLCAEDPSGHSIAMHFVEIDYSEIYYYVGRDTERTFASEEEAQAYIDANCPFKNIEKILWGDGDEEEEEEPDPDKETDVDKELETDEEFDPYEVDDPENWRIHCYVIIDTFPYGLVDIAQVAQISYFDKSASLPNRINYEMMEEYEKNMRLLCDSYINFNTAYDEPRDSRSKIASMAPTGRSAWCYVNGAYDMYNDIFSDDWINDFVPPDIIFDPVNGSAILDMYMWYISQKGNWNTIVGTTDSINDYGCCICSYAMVAQYLLGRSIDVNSIAKTQKYFSGGAFKSDTFLNDLGLSRTGYTSGFNANTVINGINNGSPTVLKINGQWNYKGKNYHGNGDHFVVIAGYDETGFYIMDPYNSNNNNAPIPYEAFGYVNIKAYSVVQ